VGLILGHSDEVTCVHISPDGQRIVSGSSDKTIKIWDIVIGFEIMTIEPVAVKHSRSHTDFTQSQPQKVTADSPARSDNLTRTASPSPGFYPTVMTNNFLRPPTIEDEESEYEKGILSVFFSPDGNKIVASYRGKIIRIWDSMSGNEIRRLKGPDPSFHPILRFTSLHSLSTAFFICAAIA
jgi:WD40 repeat protein